MYPRKPRLFFEPAVAQFQECVWHPPIDVRRTSYGWFVKVELPGVRAEDVRLELRGNSLVVSGVRKDGTLEEGDSYYVMEISYTRFERRIELPGCLENATLRAAGRDGLLLVRVELSREGGP